MGQVLFIISQIKSKVCHFFNLFCHSLPHEAILAFWLNGQYPDIIGIPASVIHKTYIWASSSAL